MAAYPPLATHAETFSLSRREIGLIVAFWLLYAALNIASRVFDTSEGQLAWSSGHAMVALVEAAGWALVTTLVFRLAARFGAESERRSAGVLLLAVLGVAIAAAFAFGGRALRAELVLPPSGGRRPGGPPLWFGFLNALIIYVGVVAAGLARAYSLRYRARRQQAAELQVRLAEAHLDALRRQLDPHFLFNTLNAVSSLVERDPRGVRRMIARLSELLRYSLDAQDGPEIPLRKELELLGRYLDIMQVRFQGRLEIRQCVADGALDALVPTMVLQPLVENAIKHGVERLDEGGRIGIEAAEDGATLTLRVTDNGPGVAPGPAPGGAGGGVGLRNTIARLEQLYGDGRHFMLSPSPDGRETVAEVRIPLRRPHG